MTYTQVSEEGDKPRCHGFACCMPKEMPCNDRRVVPSSGVSHEIHFGLEGITKQSGLEHCKWSLQSPQKAHVCAQSGAVWVYFFGTPAVLGRMRPGDSTEVM